MIVRLTCSCILAPVGGAPGRPLLGSDNFRFGSGCVSPLLKFITGKQPVEFCFPEAASRQCVLPTLSGPSNAPIAVIRYWVSALV